MANEKVLVVGAGGALGLEIVRALRGRGVRVQATCRSSRDGAGERLAALGADAAVLDLADLDMLEALLADNDAAIFTPILTVSKAAAQLLRDGRPAVFFSSNNVAVDPQAEVYAGLIDAEREVLNAAPAATILRPTMIYGHPGDGNLSRLMLAMRRLPIAPMPGGRALQQPVYYGDLAEIAADALLAPKIDERVFAVAGPAPVSQRRLYKSVARAAGVDPLIISIPAGFLAPAFRLIETMGLKSPVTAAQLARAARDKAPTGAPVILGKTPLEEGLRSLAAALDACRPGA